MQTQIARNSGDLLGGVPRHDSHVVARILRAVTVVFWPHGDYKAEWSYFQPEMSDRDMADAAAKGFGGTAYIYRSAPQSVNTLRDTASAVLYCFEA